MQKPKFEDLKPGVIFIENPALYQSINVHVVKSRPSENTSFTTETLNVYRNKWETLYLKSKDWERMSSERLSSNLRKNVVRALFTAIRE